jgi:FkbH-like protein
MSSNLPIDIYIVSDFTAQPLADALHVDTEDPHVAARMAPYDQVVPTLSAIADRAHTCDVLVVWTRPEAAIPSFRRRIEGDVATLDDLTHDVDQFATLLQKAAKAARLVFVPTWTKPYFRRGSGMLEWRADIGLSEALARLNLRLSENLQAVPNAFLLDSDRWLASIGPRAIDPKLWYMAKVYFAPSVYPLAASDIKAALRGISGRARKLVIVDLDDTLWGGIVGEEGWQALRVGGIDPIGEAFADFQRVLKSLTRKGVLLGIVSKNDESVALEALRSHPEMVLRPDDFAGWRINWDDKASNIVALVEELNLGLESVVFIDDNPVERARVREALPQVLVPEWPVDKMLYAKELESLPYFDKPTLTAEDARRTEQYRVERIRLVERETLGLTEWLSSLQLQVLIEPCSSSNLKRAAQLLNKTNQFNLTTRRITEAELWQWANVPHHCLRLFRAKDRFGEYGLVGLVSLTIDQSVGTITDYLLSCRAMGRGIEETMLAWAVQQAREQNVHRLYADFIPTARNRPCFDFFDRKSKWLRESDTRFSWDCADEYGYPDHVNVSVLPDDPNFQINSNEVAPQR